MVTDGEARRDVWLFLALLFLFSGIFYALVLWNPGARKAWGSYTLPFMWCPGLAAIVTKLVRHKSLRGLGWGWGRTRYFLIAYGLAITICLIPYVLVWVTVDAFSRSQFDRAIATAGLPSALRSPAGVALVVLVVSPLTGLISATGEEIGWRGFLVPRMQTLVGFTGASLLVGLIWAAWHYPINVAVSPLYRPNVPLWYSNVCFTAAVVGVSFMHTWLRLRSQSVWPSALFHAAGNSFQGVLQIATVENQLTSYLTTEYGVSFAVVSCLLALIFWRKRREAESATAATEPGAAPGI